MKITGQILKENRERKNISLSEVAIATKINVKTLQAMEDGDTENLPPKTFLRGFVRSYASYLTLDVNSIMSTFQEEMGSTKPKAVAPEEMPGAMSAARPSSGKPARTKPTSQEANDAINPRASIAMRIGVVAVILAVVVLIFFVKKKMESYETERPTAGLAVTKDLTVPPPPTSSPEAMSPTPSASPNGLITAVPSELASPTASPSGTPAMSTVATALPTATATPVATPTATPVPTPTPTPVPTPSPTPKPTATPKPSPTAAPAPATAPTAVPTPKPTPAPKATATPVATPTSGSSSATLNGPATGASNGAATVSPSATPKASATPKPAGRPQEVIIEALDGVEADVTIDDESPKHFSLKAEQVQSIKARRKVVLRFSDGGAVNLIVNGKERGVPGDLGKPMRIELP